MTGCQRTGKRRGFTLVELTLAVSVGLLIASIAMALFNNQLAFLRIYGAQSFLTEEAPVINLHVSKLVGKAERFRLHGSVSEALTGSNPRTDASPVLVLNFRQPDGTVRAGILAFENRGSGPALYYYVVPLTGVLGAPQWHISKQPRDLSFTVETGILRMTLTGPNGEVVTYSGAMTQ
jgi:prepilin-type N-terminal cleavage/methylation domain-containing protein